MWITEHTAGTDASPEAVWSALSALHQGAKLSERSDTFEIHGPFTVGTQISVTPQGQDTFRSLIRELDAPRVYADQTQFGGLTLLFRHTLTARPDGGTEVTHRLEIDGDGAEQIGPELDPQISEDFPVAMQDLFDAAEQGGPSPS